MIEPAKKRSTDMPDISDKSDLNRLGAVEIARGIRERQFSATDVMRACLDRISARQPVLHAFAFIDADMALRRARLADEWHAQGLPLGRLHGVPIGMKDVFDTCDMPSEYGSLLYRNRMPAFDAAVVSALRQAGGLVIGKTTTSEFGMYHQSAARNPHDALRSAGVSSAGSAVAVADHMVPIGIGTQHTASTLLPASFCGAFGFKPSFGVADMTGSNVLVPRLAQLGLLARDLADLALVLGVFFERQKPVWQPQPVRVGIVHGPHWINVDRDVGDIFDQWLATLGTAALETHLPAEFAHANEAAMTLLCSHLALRFQDTEPNDFALLCPPLQNCITRGMGVGAVDLLAADRLADTLRQRVDEIFTTVDVLATLTAPTEATMIEDGPGSGVLTTPWSLCGLPTISLPILRGPNQLPVGIQLIGRAGGDYQLLKAAEWILKSGAETK